MTRSAYLLRWPEGYLRWGRSRARPGPAPCSVQAAEKGIIATWMGFRSVQSPQLRYVPCVCVCVWGHLFPLLLGPCRGTPLEGHHWPVTVPCLLLLREEEGLLRGERLGDGAGQLPAQLNLPSGWGIHLPARSAWDPELSVCLRRKPLS